MEEFKIEVTAGVSSGEVPLGTRSIFRFTSNCENSETNPYTEVSFRLKDIPQSEEERIHFKVRFLMIDDNVLEFTEN